MNRIKASVQNVYTTEFIPEVMNFLCYRFSKNNLLQLMNAYGESFMLEFLDAFSGCYFRIPEGRKIFNVLDAYRLYYLAKKARECYDKKELQNWEMYERAFAAHCKNKMHIRTDTGRRLVRPIAREIAKANQWRKEITMQEARQNKKEL
jgi:hypothetical protein